MLNPHALALAYALSTVAGFRSALTITALSIALHVHVITVPASVGWLASDVTLVIAAVFAAADALADKIPVVDHALHVLHVVLAPAAGGIAAFALAPDIAGASGAAPPDRTFGGSEIALVVAGGAIAFAVNALRAAVRAASSALSAGFFNPFVSLAEDVCALAALVVAFVAPFAAAIALFALTLALVAAGGRALRAVR